MDICPAAIALLKFRLWFIQNKEDIKRVTVNSEIWSENIDEVKHLLKLKKIYTRRYRIAKEKLAKHGEVDAPPIVFFELEEAENGIVETMKKLQAILNTVYGKSIVIPELENAEEV